MIRFALAALAAIGVTTPALAADDAQNFVRDGITYEYTVSEKDGYRVLEGTNSTGGSFHLVVRDDRVRGYVNGKRVAFGTAEIADADIQVAQR